MTFKADSFGKRVSLGESISCGGLRLSFASAIGEVEAEESAVLLRGDTTRFITPNTILQTFSMVLALAPNPYMQPQINTLIHSYHSSPHAQEMALLPTSERKLQLLGWNSHSLY